MKTSGLSFDDSDEVVKGRRKGKLGIFFSPDFLDLLRLDLLNVILLIIFDSRDSKQDEKIAATFISEGFLSKSFERKGLFNKGWVRSFRDVDPDTTPAGKGWAVYGRKEVLSYMLFLVFYFSLQGYHGPPTFFYPRAFVRAKALVKVLPEEAKTQFEIDNSGDLKLKDGAQPIFGIRMDGIPKGPASYYHPRDIVRI